MSVNPKLVKRFNNRHDIFEAYAKYYPFEVGQNDAIGVGEIVRIKSTPDGDSPKKGELDMRTVQVSAAQVHYGGGECDTDQHTVFLKDLSPIRLGSGSGRY